MRWSDIRTRVLLAAWLPVLMVGIGLSVALLLDRSSDLNASYQQRSRAMARQVASASEYGIFSANAAQLHAICLGASKEPDVRSVDIFDAQGRLLAREGVPVARYPALGTLESNVYDALSNLDTLVQPVHSSQIELDTLFEAPAQLQPQAEQLLGHVVLVMSRQSLVAMEQSMLSLGVFITLGGLLAGSLVAFLIARGVIQPIQRISRQVERLEGGDLGFRAVVNPDDPFATLQRGLNSMAQSLQDSNQLLEYRVEKATQDLRTQKEAAEEATRTKSRFLAAASHDLRQPSHALGMIAARLMEFPHSEEEAKVIGHLSAAIRTQQDLLESLLDVAQLEAHAIQATVRPLSVAEVLAPQMNAWMAEARAKNLDFRVRQTSLWVLSDRALLTRMLLNLVHNALRYTERGGILVACRPMRSRKLARIEVWDTGVGIASQHHDEIFKEFFQVSNSERDRSKGLGLGLGIVERTAQLLGHTVRLKSVPGRGSCFCIELALATPATPAGGPVTDSTPAQSELQGVRLMVIEDDALVAQAMQMMLSSWGCEVTLASGVQEALGHLEAGTIPHIVLSDYRLRAGENGLETVQSLRTRAGFSIPACLMSGDIDNSLATVCQDAGIQFLRKPVQPATLRGQILQLLKSA
jgi:signal transduction histidine kinase